MVIYAWHQKHKQKRKKRKKIGFIKVKIPCTKGHYKQSERQPTEWENIFMKHIYDNKLVSRIQKTILTQQQKEKQPNFKKWMKDVNKLFS